jgi:hypothetical protein
VSIDRITLVIEPDREPVADGAAIGAQSTRDFFEYDRFAEQLGAQTSTHVSIREGFLRSASSDGIVLLHPSASLTASLAECDVRFRRRLLPRIVLMGAERGKVFSELEEYNLPAAITGQFLSYWRAGDRPGGGSFGLHGLLTVAERMDATITFPTGRYCIMGSERVRGLPALLKAYLDEYVKEFPMTLGRGDSGDA